jgi:hypothetical protein
VTPRRLWVAGVGTLIIVNGIAWRRGTDATLCASVLRPALDAIPGSRLLLAAGFAGLWRHLRPSVVS